MIIKSNYDNTLVNTTTVAADVLHLLFTNSAANKIRHFTVPLFSIFQHKAHRISWECMAELSI